MVYVDSGQILASTDKESCFLNQGQIIFHKPGEIHAHSSDKKAPNNMLVISFSTQSKAMEYFDGKTFEADKTVRTLLSLFISEAKTALDGSLQNDYNSKNNLDFSKAPFGSLQMLSCYFEEMLISLIRTDKNYTSKPVITPKNRVISQSSVCQLAIKFMQENVYSALTLDDICTHLMLGKSRVCNVFKTISGKSVMDYYNELKISEAKKLLRTENYSVSQISDMLGYSCIHSFSRSFKKSVGFCPTAYKNRIV